MATRDELYAAIRNADKAGDADSVQKLAAYLETLPVEVAKAPQAAAFDPSEGGGTLQFGPFDTGIRTPQGVDRFLSGMGAGMSSIGRGLGQLVGLSDQQATEEAQRLEAPLRDTGAGVAGDITGRVAALVPTVFIPGANSMAGAAAIGAGTGALTTEGDVGDRATATAIGGVAAPVGLGLGRALIAGAQAGKAALIDPFTRAGQERIAARTLQRFAGDPQAATQAIAALRAGAQAPAGVAPTAAELAQNGGIAQLERTLRQNPDLAANFTDRLAGNRAAMIQAVEGLAGDEAQMAAAVAARDAASGPLYAASRNANILPDQELAQLSQRPALQEALRRAEAIMGEQSGNVSPGQFLHNVKMALDDMLQTGPQRGIGSAESRAIQQTRGDFINWLERQSPEYGQARQAHAAASRPINQMQVGQELRDRLVPALGDYGAATRTNAASFAAGLRNGDAVAARATGMPNATLANTLEPNQLAMLEGVAQQLARRATANELGMIPGSNTAQNLVSQNILAQTLGPLGLPQTFTENTLAQTLLRPAQWVGQLGEPRVLNRLAAALLDPQDAANLLATILPQRAIASNAVGQTGRLLGPVGGMGMLPSQPVN